MLQDLLRKTLHWNYDHYRAQKECAFVNSEYIVQVHATHCLDILRQVLMCDPDVGVLGQVWWQPKSVPDPMPFVDFNTKQKCRDSRAFERGRRHINCHQRRKWTCPGSLRCQSRATPSMLRSLRHSWEDVSLELGQNTTCSALYQQVCAA
jgi:hypothetical protein